MLPKIRRVSSILRNNNNNNNNNNNESYTKNNKLIESADRLSNKSNSSSSKSTEDGNNVYIETLLYIVHVDDIDLPVSTTDEVTEEMYDGGDEQQSTSSNKIIRRVSKRTTASFNERHQTSKVPIYTRPSFTFSNPLRRLNSLLKTTENSSTPKLNNFRLYSSLTKRSSSFINQSCLQSQINNNNKHEKALPLPPPPPSPSYLYDNPISSTEQRPTIQAKGPGLTDGFVNDNCHFDLDAPHAELQKLVIAVDGPSKADIQIEIIDTGIYRVFYICQTPGNYHISVTYDGEQIDGSPYHLRLRAQPLQEQVVPPTLPPPINPPHATIEPREFYINTPCIVTVHPVVPSAVFQAYIQAPQKNINLPITVHKSAKSECYEIYFIPNTCGNHWLNVSLNHIPIFDNPHRLIVRSSSSTKSIIASGQGESSQFFVSKSPNDPSSETGTFSVGISGPSTVFLDANETEHGYEFHYKPMRSGKYIITIKNGGKHIQGSPFICRVYNKLNEGRTILSIMHEKDNDIGNETTTATTTQTTTTTTTSRNSLIPNQSVLNPIRSSIRSTTHVDLDILRSSMIGDASQVCVFGTGLYETKPRRKTTFKIDASQAGPGLLLVGLYSSFGPCERLVVKRIMPSSPSYIYKVSYRVQVRGQYMLVILYGSNMQHVPGSPYLVTVE
ncbi:unnamed protein product [Rotaria sordida]|uniref:Filamin n=1 Tax=Rotaria sordida TaxID=392033 RepID=A0A813YF12_9BILA|nr:unnamed protein product [Rotaria sordida]